MASDDILDITYERNKDKVLAEQCLLLHASLPLPLIILFANALLLVTVQWPIVSHSALIAWLSAIAVITVLRAGVYLAFRKADPKKVNHTLWLYIFIMFVCLTSITWGSTAIFMFPTEQVAHVDRTAHEIFLALILAGNAAAMITTLSFNQLAVRIFLLVTLLPLCLKHLFFETHEMSTLIGAVGLFYITVLVVNAGRVYKNTLQNILLRIRSENLENATELLESAHEGILVNAGGKHVFVNKKLADMLGYEADELIGTGVDDIIHPDELNNVKAHHKPPGAGNEPPTQYETTFISKHGQSVPVEVSVTETPWHGQNASTVIARDISKRLENRTQLKDSYDEMERHVVLRTENLQQEIASHKLTEATLHQSEHKLHSILNTIIDAIITIDVNGVITTFNPATEKIFGYTAAELIGINVAMLMSEDQAAVHDDYMSGHLTTGQSRVLGKRRQLYGKRKNGEVFPIDIAINDFAIDGNRFFSGVLRDTTVQVQANNALKESQNRLAHLLTSTPVVIYTCRTTDDYGATYISENITEMMGYKPSQFVDDSSFWGKSIHPDDKDKTFNQLETLFETGHHEHEYRFKKADGSYMWVHDELKLTYDENSNPAEIVGYWADISARKKAEIKTIDAREEAERANSAKSDFLSRMSHEFRTPLNVILGFSQLLSADKKETLGKQQKENVGHITKAGKHLLELINEILYLTKIEAGKLNLIMSNIPLEKNINESINLIRPLAEKQKITISCQLHDLENVHIHADPVRLREVLLNLLSNAVKYNRVKGTVSITCEIINKKQIKISLTDSGPGLTAKQQKLLFKPFERIHAENSEQEGTGIGLLISQHLIEAMGGKIGFSSEAGTGSTFWLKLNLASEADVTDNNESVVSAVPAPTDRTYTVLYVDDNESGLQLVKQLLKQRTGIKTYVSNNPEKGLDIAKKEIPDLILLDINMPNMNGYEVLAHLKKNRKTQHIPVIALSANAMPEDISRGNEADFREYLTKPIDIDKFYTALDAALSER